MNLLLANAMLFVYAASTAAARTFQCNEVWSSPSSNNNFADCFTNVTHVTALLTSSSQLGYAVLVAIPLVVFVFGLICCPMTTIARYCCKCCGSYRRRPGTCCCGGSEWDSVSEEEKNQQYSKISVFRTQTSAVLLLLIGIGALIMCVDGVSTLQSSYAAFFADLKSILSYVSTQEVGIRTLVTINSTGQLIPPLSSSFFDFIDTKISQIGGQINTAQSDASTYVNDANIVALVIGIVPVMFLVLTVLCAVMDIRTCLPCCNICLHYIFFIPYALLATVFFAVGLVVGDVCGERDLFLSNSSAPGLISLAAVPLCNSSVPFSATETDISNTITAQATNACASFLDICSSTQTEYNTSHPNLVFSCHTLQSASQCTTFSETQSVAQSMVIFPNAPVSCLNGTTYLENCTFTQCQTYCVNATVRNSTITAGVFLFYASNAELAFDLYVRPLLSCDNLYTIAVSHITVCSTLITSVYIVGAAFFIFEILFLLGMVVLWRGQKRFFKRRINPTTASYRAPFEMPMESSNAANAVN